MTTNNKELEQIAKQVSLLNRLLELLRMQEGNYIKPDLFFFGWSCLGADKFFLKGQEDGYIPCFSLNEAWNHPITQKAWSDELVKVARELEAYEGVQEPTISVLTELRPLFWVDRYKTPQDTLELILNKYGRSLSE